MQPHTLYIYLTTSELFLAKEEHGETPHLELVHREISPQTPFAKVLGDALIAKNALHTDIKNVRIFVDSPIALIPMAEFSEETFRTYYDYCIPSENEKHIFCDPLPAANAMLVFSVPENIYMTLKDKFENVHFSSSITHLAGYFIKRNTFKDTPKRMLVSLMEGTVDIIVVEAGRLLAINSFETGAESDVLYYTFSIASKLGLSVEADTIYIVGPSSRRESVIEEMKKFARNIGVLELPENVSKYDLSDEDDLPFNLITALAET